MIRKTVLLTGLLGVIALFSCKSQKASNKGGGQAIQNESSIKENKAQPSVLIRHLRTPCFGTCPAYKLEVFTDGLVKMHGDNFVDKLGSWELQLSSEQLAGLKAAFEEAGFYDLEDSYMEQIPDVPTVTVEYYLNQRKKVVVENMNGPDKLHILQRTIDALRALEGWKKSSGSAD